MSSQERLSECFPSLALAEPEALQRAHEQIREFVVDNVVKDFEKLNADRNLDHHLTRLDNIISTQHEQQQPSSSSSTVSKVSVFDPASQPNPKPVGLDEVRRAALSVQKQNHVIQLRQLYQSEVEQCAQSSSTVRQSMHRLQEMQTEYEAIRRVGISKANQSLQSVPCDQMTDDVDLYLSGLC